MTEEAKESMKGKVCLVTGATGGIGEVTARELARLGAAVVVVGRSAERGARTVEGIRQATGNGAVEFLRADLSSQAEIRRLASEFLMRHDRLDVLVNNAGALFALRRESTDGIEMTFALNHLGYFLLTQLLLEVLKASAPSRIINVASSAHRSARALDFEDPQGRSDKPYPQSEGMNLLYTLAMPWAHPGYARYAQSKLANILFTYELAEKLQGTGVTVNALHPGFVDSGFGANNGTFGRLVRFWASLFAISSTEGARTSVYLATSPEVAGVSGGYFVKCKPVSSSPASRDREAAHRLWQLSEELTARS